MIVFLESRVSLWVLYGYLFLFTWQVCGPLDENEKFTTEDVDLLTKVEYQNVARSIKTQMMLMGVEGNRYIRRGSYWEGLRVEGREIKDHWGGLQDLKQANWTKTVNKYLWLCVHIPFHQIKVMGEMNKNSWCESI